MLSFLRAHEDEFVVGQSTDYSGVFTGFWCSLVIVFPVTARDQAYAD